MRRFLHWYGDGPLHLLTLLGSFALAGYAAAELLPNNYIGIPVWFVAAVIGHDLILMPLYTLADRSAAAVFRRSPLKLPAVSWVNYLRVPAGLSGLLLLIWFPLIFRLPTRFPLTTTLSLDPYLWHWLGVTGALFLLSATALAVRLGTLRRRSRVKARLAASERAGRALVGTVLPDVRLLDARGAATTLYTAAGDGLSVLVFYCGAWCPYCSSALSAYRVRLLPRLTERGIRLVAVSPQPPDRSLTGFTVVSDPGNAIAGRLGLLTQPAEKARAALPVPAAVILDAARVVRWIDVQPDFSGSTGSRQIIGALDHRGHWRPRRWPAPRGRAGR
jgi:peroxiredoxin